MSGASEYVPSDDRGLLLGDGLFETIRLYGGRPFRLPRHLERLTTGAASVGIPVPHDLADRAAGALAAWGDRDGILRLTLTRGSGWGLAPPEPPRSRLLVAVRPLVRAPTGRPRPAPGEALTARVLGRVDERSLVAGLKTIGYLERVQALRLARRSGADEALLRNSLDRIVEGSASNLVAAIGRTVVSPGPADGALAGITRAVVLEEASRLGWSVEERGLEAAELGALAELLLTSSVREVVPVVEIDGRPVGDGTPGPIGRELTERFQAVVRKETGAGG